MKNREFRLLPVLILIAAYGNVFASGTAEVMTDDSYPAVLGQYRIILSRYGNISSLEVIYNGKQVIMNSSLLLHYETPDPAIDQRIFDQENREDAVKNPVKVIRESRAVVFTKKSLLGHKTNPESLLVSREIWLDDKGKLEVRFEIEYLKDVVFTAPPCYSMQFALPFLRGGYSIDDKMGIIQANYNREGEFKARGKRIRFATDFGLLSLAALNNTGFSGYDLRRASAQSQALRIDAVALSGPHSKRYSFPKGAKQSFGFIITLPAFQDGAGRGKRMSIQS